jgi:hypothetical protein
MVLLQRAQPPQLPISHPELGGGSTARLLALGALSASNPEVLLQLRDPGGRNCEAAGKKCQPIWTKERKP